MVEKFWETPLVFGYFDCQELVFKQNLHDIQSVWKSVSIDMYWTKNIIATKCTRISSLLLFLLCKVHGSNLEEKFFWVDAYCSMQNLVSDFWKAVFDIQSFQRLAAFLRTYPLLEFEKTVRIHCKKNWSFTEPIKKGSVDAKSFQMSSYVERN